MDPNETCGPFTTLVDAQIWLDNSGTRDWVWFDGYDEGEHALFLYRYADGEHPDAVLSAWLLSKAEDPDDYSMDRDRVEEGAELLAENDLPSPSHGNSESDDGDDGDYGDDDVRVDEVLRDKAQWYPTLESVTEALAALDEKPHPSSQQAAEARQEDRANLERLAECYRLGWLKEARS